MVAFIGPACTLIDWQQLSELRLQHLTSRLFDLLTDCTRLWCVYELATFSKYHKHELPQRLLLLSISWASVFSLFKDPELTVEERSAFCKFHCRDARCFKPSDRAYVLKAIRDEWGSEEVFDQYVQTELPKIFAASKRAYSQLLWLTLLSNLEHMFGD
jgi:hypothetical protein